VSSAQAMTHLCDDIVASFDQRRQAPARRQEDVRSLRQDFARQGEVRHQARCACREDVQRFLADTGAARDTMARGLRTELRQATKQRQREVFTAMADFHRADEERREAWEGQRDNVHHFLAETSAARGARGRQLREDLSRATEDRQSQVREALNGLHQERTEAEKRWATLTRTMAQRRAGARGSQ